jgi:hypothetical protein
MSQNEAIEHIKNNLALTAHWNQDNKPISDVETIVKKLWKNGAVEKGDKLLPKNQTIDIKSRTQAKLLTSIYKEMVELSYAELRGNKGYYAVADYHTVLSAVGGGV